MTLDEIVSEGVGIWRDHPKLSAADQVVVLAKVLGDLSALARAKDEQGGRWTGAQRTEWVRELGNLVATSARLIDEANRDCENAVRAALASQRAYAAELAGEQT